MRDEGVLGTPPVFSFIPPPSALIPLFEDGEHFARVDGRARFDSDFNDRTRLRRLQLVLHLHRLDDDYASARLTLLTLRDEHAHDLPGHLRRDLRAPALVRCDRARAAQVLRVGERDGVLARADRDAQLASRTRGTRRADATFVNAPAMNQKVLANA